MRIANLLALWGAVLAFAALSPVRTSATEPENLALKATVSASSFVKIYNPKFVADGNIAPQECGWDWWYSWASDKCGKCNKRAHGPAVPGHKGDTDYGADLHFEWNAPVNVAEVVYYGRTAMTLADNFKDYEIIAEAYKKPIASGSLQMVHGPQRMPLANPVETGKITIRFLTSYGGHNPGASEVQIYSEIPSDALLNRRGLINETPELAARLRDGDLGFEKVLLIQRHQVNPSHVYTYHAEGFQAGGALCLLAPGEDGGELQELVASPDGQMSDCELSFDAKEIVFSWKKNKDDPYHVYRINVDGSGLTQLTSGASNNLNACWLPDGGIAFLSDRKPAYAYCMATTAPTLYRMDRDGGNVIRISANYLNDFTPSVLEDGRIIFGRWEYVDRPAIPIQSLWTMRPDGTGLSVYFGNRVLSPATFMEARAIPGSTKTICVMTGHNGPCRGAIGVIDRTRGVNAQEAILNITPEVNIGLIDKGNGNAVWGPYENPYPIDSKYFFVSHFGEILLRDYEGMQQTTVIERRDGMGFYSAQAVQPRFKPDTLPSFLPEEADEWATVYVQDVYDGLGPSVKRGEIKELRVVQEIEKPKAAKPGSKVFGYQFPVVSCGATYAPKKVWGHGKVEEDGSANFKVPAGQPIYFMALDADGRAVQRMRSFTHLMPGESQGCIGCHETRTQASRNYAMAEALKRDAQELEPPEWGLKGFSYSEIVQPVLDENCVTCHNALEHPKGIDLSGDKTDFFNVSYEILARKGTKAENERISGVGYGNFGENPYTNWIPTYNGQEQNILHIEPKEWGSHASKLADIVLSGHPGKDGEPRIDLAENERRRILAWIDLNVPYYGTSAFNLADNKGCRKLRPDDLDRVLRDVAERRCASCHADDAGLDKKSPKIPPFFYVRVTNPHLNGFLLAPLAKSAGGTAVCGVDVFESADDPDYQEILRTFDPLHEFMERNIRMDMVDAQDRAY